MIYRPCGEQIFPFFADALSQRAPFAAINSLFTIYRGTDPRHPQTLRESPPNLPPLAATRLLGSLLAGVSPHDPSAFAAVAALLVAVALVANLAPARRASAVDPMTALRLD